MHISTQLDLDIIAVETHDQVSLLIEVSGRFCLELDTAHAEPR